MMSDEELQDFMEECEWELERDRYLDEAVALSEHAGITLVEAAKMIAHELVRVADEL